jgi:hypothetical protein
MTAVICVLALALGSFIYVFAPVRQLVVPHGKRKSRLEYLRERKDQIYDNLRDLNFEFNAGKFPESDYVSMRDSLEREAAAVLAEIEDLQE